MYPLVRELAATGAPVRVPVAVTCRVLKLARQPYYRWLAAPVTDAELARAYRERYSGPRRALAVARLARAQELGQLRPDVDPEVVVDQLWGACYHRLLLPDQPLTEQFARALVHNLLHGVLERPGGA